MDDLTAKIAHIESMRAVIGDTAANAAIAALRAEAVPPAAQQTIAASVGGSIASAPQSSVGGDMRDNALGSGNLVLHDITITAGGVLQIGALPADLPPRPEELRQALATYLRTLLERHQFLSLHGLGVSSTQQVRIALRAVFIDVRTNVTISEASDLFAEDTARGRHTPARRAAGQAPPLSDDLRQWLDELLSDAERDQLLGAEDAAPPQPDTEIEVLAGLRRDPIKAKLLAPRTALELIRHHRALVLLGDPGSGKSTILRHLALSFALARLQADAQDTAALDADLAWSGPLPLPILIPLRRFADDLSAAPMDAGPLLAHIERTLTGDRHAALAQHLLARLDAGTVLLLCDGLDEIANDTRRAWAAQAVALFQSRFLHSRVVLTSRTYAYRAPCQLPSVFQVTTLQPLDTAAQDTFIARWYRAMVLQGSGLVAEQEHAAPTKARDLIAAMALRPRLREIAANPLLLTMMVLVHQHRLRLPQQRSELYKECLQLLLEQWEQQRADGSPAGLAAALGIPDQTDRLPLIQPIAYQLQVLGREEARQAEIRDWLLPRFLDLASTPAAAQALIERLLAFLEGRSGLLIARDIKDYYAFPHRTFQEYLTARELLWQGTQHMHAEVLARRHAVPWREVILLIAGHLVANGFPQEACALAWALLDADPPGTPEYDRNAVLAGEIVEELESAPGHAGQHVKDDVTARLVALVQGGRLPAKERVDAAFLLGRLGDPRLPSPAQLAYWCEVDGRPFWFGDDREKAPLAHCTLPYRFRIARYTVTNAEYRHFVEAGGYDSRRPWWTKAGRAWLKQQQQQQPVFWNDTNYNGPTQPVVGVTWYEAAAYCRWLTRAGLKDGWLPTDDEIRLPSSLEWERAARHTDKRHYPWGRHKPNPEHSNYAATAIGRPAPVGCFPLGVAVCGAHDMVGNVSEWLAAPWDSQQASAVKKDFTDNQIVSFTYSSFVCDLEHLCCGARYRDFPFSRVYGLGIRLVWSRALTE